MNLKKELKRHGCDMAPDHFRAVVEKVFNRLYPNLTDDAMLYQPTLTLHFDNEVRNAVGCGVPDEIINRTLVNLRKQSRSRHRRHKRIAFGVLKSPKEAEPKQNVN